MLFSMFSLCVHGFCQGTPASSYQNKNMATELD